MHLMYVNHNQSNNFYSQWSYYSFHAVPIVCAFAYNLPTAPDSPPCRLRHVCFTGRPLMAPTPSRSGWRSTESVSLLPLRTLVCSAPPCVPSVITSKFASNSRSSPFLLHPARFSPDDKFSRQRVTTKKRFGQLPTQKPGMTF